MLKLELFTRESCPRCISAKILAGQLRSKGYYVTDYDLDSVDGIAEGRFHRIIATPALLLVNEQDHELANWRGEVPAFESVRQEIERHLSHGIELR